MKRALSVLLMLMLVLGLVACGTKPAEPPVVENQPPVVEDDPVVVEPEVAYVVADGYVRDDKGAPVTGCTVEIYSKDSSEVQTVVTDDKGYFLFAGVSEGEHTLSVLDKDGNKVATCDLTLKTDDTKKTVSLTEKGDGYLAVMPTDMKLELTIVLGSEGKATLTYGAVKDQPQPEVKPATPAKPATKDEDKTEKPSDSVGSGSGSGSSSSGHRHKYPDTWTMDETNHWKVATCHTYAIRYKAAHSFEDVAAVEATCSATGTTAGKKCSICGYTVGCEEVELDQNNHAKTVAVAAVPATCVAEGTTAGRKCADCGVITAGCETVAKDAANHKNFVTVPAVEPTCTATGLTAGQKCADCGVETIAGTVVPMAAHDYQAVPGVTATCTATGLTAGQKCAVCGNTVGCEVIPVDSNNHLNFETIPGKAPTCTETGLTDGQKCADCGVTTTAQNVIDANGHSSMAVDAVPATCTEDGTTAGTKCSVCQETLTGLETIGKLGHAEVVLTAIPATCTEDGLTEGKKCSRCNEILVAQEVDTAKGHTMETVLAKSATCTTAGLTEGKKCATCGEVETAQETVPALGHAYDEGVETTPATCEDKGVKTFTCANENCPAKTYTEDIPKLGHTWVEGETVTGENCEENYTTYACSVCQATENRSAGDKHTFDNNTLKDQGDGTHVQVCDTCGAVKSDVSAVAHTFVEGTADPAATCLTNGSRTDTCACGATKVVTLPATGHTYDDGVVTDPTCTNGGYTTYTCTNGCAADTDGRTYTANETSPKGHKWPDTWTPDEVDSHTRTCENGCETTQKVLCPITWADAEDGVNHTSTCPTCEYVYTAEHTYPATYTKLDENQHGRNCNVCSYLQRVDHSFDLTGDYTPGDFDDPAARFTATFACEGNGCTQTKEVSYMARIGNKLYATLDDAVKDADADATIYLAEGDHTMPNSSKDVTIIGTVADDGAKLSTLKVAGVTGQSNTITLKNLNVVGVDDSVEWGDAYTLAHTKAVIYDNCTIVNLITAYSPSSFTNCVFNNNTVDQYSVFCYGAGEHSFTSCVFNTATDEGKAIKLYNHGAMEATLNVSNCEFNASKNAGAGQKAAVELDSTYGTLYILKINNCKTNENYTKLWSDKSTKSEVYVDGKVASNAALAASVAAAEDGDTIHIAAGEFEPINLKYKKVNLVGSVDGKDPATKFKTVTAPTALNDAGVWVGFEGTVDNIVFEAANNVANNSSYGALTLRHYDVADTANATFRNCHFVNQGITFSGTVSFTNCVFDGKNHVNRAFNYCIPNGDVTLDGCTIKNYLQDSFHLGEVPEGKSVTATIKNSNISGKPMELGNINALVFENTVLDCTVNVYVEGTAVSFGTCTMGDNFALSIPEGMVVTDKGGNVNDDEKKTPYYFSYCLDAAGNYCISDADGMFKFAKEVNENKNSYAGKTVKLMTNIDLAKKAWTPIGQTGATTFLGTFDGNGKTISNLSINTAEVNEYLEKENHSTGLFGWLNGTVENLTIDGAEVTANKRAGAVAGYLESPAVVKNCIVKNAKITAKHIGEEDDTITCGDKAGAVVGMMNANCAVTDCKAYDCQVIAGRDAGQIVGAGYPAVVTGCEAGVDEAGKTTVTVASDNSNCKGGRLNETIVGRDLTP